VGYSDIRTVDGSLFFYNFTIVGSPYGVILYIFKEVSNGWFTAAVPLGQSPRLIVHIIQ
jgi:hypothetical protein